MTHENDTMRKVISAVALEPVCEELWIEEMRTLEACVMHETLRAFDAFVEATARCKEPPVNRFVAEDLPPFESQLLVALEEVAVRLGSGRREIVSLDDVLSATRGNEIAKERMANFAIAANDAVAAWCLSPFFR